jgi:hypothetical protein
MLLFVCLFVLARRPTAQKSHINNMFAIKIENLFAIEIEHVFPLKLKFQMNYVYNDFILTHLIFIFILTFVNLNYTLLVLAVIYF